MTLADDDRFRRAGRFEHEEPVAVAAIQESAAIDWSDGAHSPAGTLWIPETLFHQLAATTRLSSIDLSKQTRLTRQECRALAEELAILVAAAQDPDVRVAATLVRERAEAVAVSGQRQVLLIEGP